MRRNVHSSAVFAGGRPLWSQILPGQGRPPATIHGVGKLETLGYPKVKTASLCVPSFWQYRSVTDRQTDRRMDGFAVIYTALAKLCYALRSTVKTNDSCTVYSKSLGRGGQTHCAMC